ncbi:hypothetical protein BT93_D1181 [Corymbia citriodora subsp. variegata]|nr:hypothetical protein BT93_D1181 [Corymbia citriodora subsp. variegata]
MNIIFPTSLVNVSSPSCSLFPLRQSFSIFLLLRLIPRLQSTSLPLLPAASLLDSRVGRRLVSYRFRSLFTALSRSPSGLLKVHIHQFSKVRLPDPGRFLLLVPMPHSFAQDHLPRMPRARPISTSTSVANCSVCESEQSGDSKDALSDMEDARLEELLRRERASQRMIKPGESSWRWRGREAKARADEELHRAAQDQSFRGAFIVCRLLNFSI